LLEQCFANENNHTRTYLITNTD